MNPPCQYHGCTTPPGAPTIEHIVPEVGTSFYCAAHDKPHFHLYRHRDTYQ